MRTSPRPMCRRSLTLNWQTRLFRPMILARIRPHPHPARRIQLQRARTQIPRNKRRHRFRRTAPLRLLLETILDRRRMEWRLVRPRISRRSCPRDASLLSIRARIRLTPRPLPHLQIAPRKQFVHRSPQSCPEPGPLPHRLVLRQPPQRTMRHNRQTWLVRRTTFPSNRLRSFRKRDPLRRPHRQSRLRTRTPLLARCRLRIRAAL